MSVEPDLCLYNMTLQRSSSLVASLIGNFEGNKSQQEVVRATGSTIELWKLNSSTGKFYRVVVHDVFSIVRNVAKFRNTGSHQDYLIITSDSGNLTLVKYDKEKKDFVTLSNEPYYKTGTRRLSPGDYVAIDGKSRACMVASLEKTRFVYTFRRDGDGLLSMSSPIDASKSKLLTFDICALDVGFENPLFAAIECNYGDYENNKHKKDIQIKKTLSYYELDLGLNHVVKKYTEILDQDSNFMLSLPGGIDGPSGFLLCSENLIQYKYLSKMTHCLPIPKREDNNDALTYIVSGVVHKMKRTFFVLLQSNFGDLYKISFDFDPQDSDETNGEGGAVNSIEISYFDSMPICNSLVIFKSGFLYGACENGDHYIYQFEKLGDDPDQITWKSSEYPDDVAAIEEKAVFTVKPFDNIAFIEISENLNPVIASNLYNPGTVEELPTINAICGSGSRSSFKSLKSELSYTEIVSSELPSQLINVFTTKFNRSDKYDKLILLSFLEATLILSVGETVEEVSDSGFLSDVSTICLQQIGESSTVQIHSNGMIQVVFDEENSEKKIEWFPPAGINILAAACNNSQVVIALSNREIVYFEIDEFDRLIEYEERKELSAQICSISVSEVPSGKQRFPYFIVGCRDSTITIISTDPESTLDTISVETLSSIPSSLLIMDMNDKYHTASLDKSDEDDDDDNDAGIATGKSTYLHIGMESGVYARLKLDTRTGELSEPTNKFIGPKALTLSSVKLMGQNVVAICSTKVFLGYTGSKSGLSLTPLAPPVFGGICSFVSEDCPVNGILGIHENNLHIMTVDQLDNDFVIDSVGLRYTPRAMVDNSEDSGLVYICESEFNIQSPFIEIDDNEVDTKNGEIVTSEYDQELHAYYQQFGYPYKLGSGGSCLQVIGFKSREIVQTIELLNNEAIFRITKVVFESNPDHSYIVVSTTVNLKMESNTSDETYLRVYKIEEDGSLSFVHKTKTQYLCLAVAEFQGHLLCGMKDVLTMYDLGIKQLLKKSVTKIDGFNEIVDIKSQGFRLSLSDNRNSVKFVVYKPLEKLFIPFIDDTVQRYTTSTVFLDYRTVLGGDRFGNLWVLRCPEDESTLADSDSHGMTLINKEGFCNGSPYRFQNECNFYIQDIPTSFSRGSLIAGGSESVFYTGLQGTIGVVNPITSKSDYHFFQTLQKLVAQNYYNLTERDNLKYRSYYSPRRCVIDGDLVEKYLDLPFDKRDTIAVKMELSPEQINKRILDMRSRIVY